MPAAMPKSSGEQQVGRLELELRHAAEIDHRPQKVDGDHGQRVRLHLQPASGHIAQADEDQQRNELAQQENRHAVLSGLA
jgi:hypothetical protein